MNRPIADVGLRQLILAKTLDNLTLRLGHQALFPFIVQPQVNNGTQNVDIPPSWIWDMQGSLPKKWERLRLARVKRISGRNADTSDPSYTGILRLVFTAQEEGSSSEVSIFQIDYQIDSTLTFQEGKRLQVPTSNYESLPLNPSEVETVGGFATFLTLDTSDVGVQAFLSVAAPPDNATEVDSSGYFLNPTIVEVNDSLPGGSGITGDFNFSAVSHGTGVLTLSAYNPIPSADSTVTTWLNTFNYPYDSKASLQASNSVGVTIPKGLFREFDLAAPSSDEATGDVSGNFFPSYVSRIERVDVGSDTLRFYFATFNVEAASIVPVEFASLDLARTDVADTILSIVPTDNLFPTKTGNALWEQGFGKGHVVLSDLWTGTSDVIETFFDSFVPIIDSPAQAVFTKEATRLSSFGLSRIPEYTPTAGQSAALRGSRDGTTDGDPSSANRYVVEADQGLGDQIDLVASISENPDIERFGFTGSLTHKLVKLVVNSSGTDHGYEDDILPRLRLLLGRDPVFGDEWWDGTRFKKFDGDKWIAP
tara:strand:- start:7305 stop:8912 length:1608 start_codon:yes stop_codon:yes gene_type:complete